jgi:hypothetical protein
MTWQVTQSGSSFSGSMTVTDPAINVTGRGPVSGSVSRSTLQYTITVPPGGFDGVNSGCSSTVSGTGTLSRSSINGTYAGTSTCPPNGIISSGTLALTKQ